MLWIVIMLEIEVAPFHVELPVGSQDIVLQYLAIELLVEVSFNPHDVPNPL
jgi:hypothetical protein